MTEDELPWRRAMVIHLRERPHRLEKFYASAEAAGVCINVTTFQVQRSPNPREGCLRSHLAALAAVVVRAEPTAIFEDDAIFVPDFRAKLARFMAHVPNTWEVLWLGGHHQHRPRPVAQGVVAPVQAHRSHAYVVRNSDTAWRLHAGIRAHLRGLGPDTPAPHYDHVVARVMSDRMVRLFAPDPWLVGQAAGPSDITGGDARERWS